jgi:uncharacterized protein YegP (UPF0339 family)
MNDDIRIASWLTNHGDHVRVYRSRRRRRQRWYWHVASVNGEIVEQGETYVQRIDAIVAAERHHPRIVSE